MKEGVFNIATDKINKTSKTISLKDDRYYIQAVKFMSTLKRKELLELHNHKIWFSKDGYWKTYIDDKEKGRVLKSCKKLENLENMILISLIYVYDPTVEDMFVSYINKKIKRREIEKSTEVRYKNVFKKYCGSIRDLKVRHVDEETVEDYLIDIIVNKEISRKAYNNLCIVLRGIFRTARKNKLIEFSISNLIEDLEVSGKMFKKVQKKNSELVFTKKEKEAVIRECMSNLDARNLAILLMFKTGMRIGEVVSLKSEAITDFGIFVTGTEVSYHMDGKVTYYIRADMPKTEAGIRHVVLKAGDEWILNKMKELGSNSEYIFSENGQRVNSQKVRDRLRSIEKKIGIAPLKYPNKILKTYASELLNSGVPEAVIKSQIGHTLIQTTKNFYYYDIFELAERRDILNSVDSL